MIAIMMGAEVGLTPMASVQRIAVINKRPTIWGDAALGIVRASGLLEDIEETVDDGKATCMVRRKGEKRDVVRTFTKQDAVLAGLWAKTGPWATYPRRMLQMRARAFALRDVFPDVLGGLYITEELQGGEDARDVTPALPAPAVPAIPPIPKQIEAETEKPARKPVEPMAGRDKRGPQVAPVKKTQPAKTPELEIVDPDTGELLDPGSEMVDFFERLEEELGKVSTADDVHQVWADMDVEATCVEEFDLDVCRAIRGRRLGELGAADDGGD